MTWHQKNRVNLESNSQNCLTYKQKALTDGQKVLLDCPQVPGEAHHTILREGVEAAVKGTEDGKVR